MNTNNPSLPRTLVDWVRIFGPGAIIASATIGTGELVFSSRAGAIFGYRILWVFLAISVMKWALTVASARHFVLTGTHPVARWMELPGPRGWLPMTFLMLGVLTFPVWAGFLAGVTGTLLKWLTGFDHHLCGAAVLAVCLVLGLTGSYQILERAQLLVVAAMMLAVTTTLVLLNPEWLQILKGLFVPQRLEYPQWVLEEHPKISARPLWVELSTYASVIGGASYDYLAYTSFLRDKRWGLAGGDPADDHTLQAIAADASHPIRRWVQAPLVDSTLSFVVVLIFAAVFVASGAMILGPEHKIPSEQNLLNLQAEFVTRLHPWLLPLYIVGALLTMLGTVYCTLEIFPAFFREWYQAVSGKTVRDQPARLHRACVVWTGVGGLAVLGWSALSHASSGAEKPAGLVEIITPAALFTGVLSCAFVCFLNVWMDRRFLPAGLRMPSILTALNLISGVLFLVIGVKSYWDYGTDTFKSAGAAGGWIAFAILASIFAIGWTGAEFVTASARSRDGNDSQS